MAALINHAFHGLFETWGRSSSAKGPLWVRDCPLPHTRHIKLMCTQDHIMNMNPATQTSAATRLVMSQATLFLRIPRQRNKDKMASKPGGQMASYGDKIDLVVLGKREGPSEGAENGDVSSVCDQRNP